MASIYPSLSRMKDSEKYTDLVLKCKGGQTFRVHRVILCAQSEYFDNACGGSFKEALTGEIDLQDDEPYLVEKLIDYCYTGDYTQGMPNQIGRESAKAVAINARDKEEVAPAEPRLSEDEKPLSDAAPEPDSSVQPWAWPTKAETIWANMADAVKVYLIADKRFVHGLQSLALARFEIALESAEHLTFSAYDELAAIAEDIYKNTKDTDLGLKEPLCRLLFNKRRDRAMWESLQSVLRTHADFASAVLNYWNYEADRPPSPTLPRKKGKGLQAYVCSHCGGSGEEVRKGRYFYPGDGRVEEPTHDFYNTREGWAEQETRFIRLYGDNQALDHEGGVQTE